VNNLQRLVLAALSGQDRTYRQIEDRTGGRLKRSTLSWVARGASAGYPVTAGTLAALSEGLGVPLADVKRAAAQDTEQRTRLLDAARALTPAGRSALLAHAEHLLELERNGAPHAAQDADRRGRRGLARGR
jgi:transcriptional regulator with XRE-family HTH domain